MTFRLLIDECLSPELVQLAVDAGHVESTCVRNRGLAGKGLATHGVCRRERLHALHSQLGRFSRQRTWQIRWGACEAAHPLRTCLSELGLHHGPERQRYLFEVALQEIAGMADLVNRALELFELADSSVEIEVYEIPES